MVRPADLCDEDTRLVEPPRPAPPSATPSSPAQQGRKGGGAWRLVRARLGRLTRVEEKVMGAGAEQLEPALQAVQCRETGTTVWDCQLCLLILNLELVARHGSKHQCNS